MPANPIKIGKRYVGVGTREGLKGICCDVSTTGFGHHFAQIKADENVGVYKAGDKIWCRSSDLELEVVN